MEIWRKSIPASCVDSVHFLGRVGDPARLYAAAGVVILPSLWDEPFGLVLAEAMACGAVVVATRRGAFPTIAGGSPGVMLVEPGNAVQLVDAVQGMFAKGPTETDRMGRMNRARIEAAYSVETFVSRYERLLVDEVKKYRESTVSGSGE
jgi:glycosyltransferase involved in cell wall biosynthesis